MTSNLSWSLAKGTWPELKEITAKLTQSPPCLQSRTLSSDNAASPAIEGLVLILSRFKYATLH